MSYRNRPSNYYLMDYQQQKDWDRQDEERARAERSADDARYEAEEAGGQLARARQELASARDEMAGTIESVELELSQAREDLETVMEQRDALLAACKRFVATNAKHGYEFDSNEPEVFAEIVAAIANAEKHP